MFTLSLGFVLTVSSAWGQVDLSAWPHVRMEVLAVDRDGNPLQGLSADAVLARGAGKPHPVESLVPVNEQQSVCILLDASDGDRWSMEQAKAKKLVKNLAPGDEVCVAAFSSQLWIAQDWTQDRFALSRALALGRPEGGTQLRDAVFDLAEYMRKTAHNRSRAIILMSDGTDHHSQVTWAQLKQSLEAEGSPMVHMVCLPEAFGRARAKQFDPHSSEAFRITEMSGGLTYFPHTMGDMNGLADTLPIAISSRYLLTVNAENAKQDGHEEHIEISFDKAHRKQNLHIQAPEGFYAPSQ